MFTALNASPEPTLWPMAWALPPGVHAVCSTRLGGVSQPPFDGFNLGDHVQDEPDAVAANRAIFQNQLGGAKPIFLSQVHGTRVLHLDATSTDGTQADACFTRTPQLACTIMVADCLPLLFTDDRGLVVAAAHAGWRGLAGAGPRRDRGNRPSALRGGPRAPFTSAGLAGPLYWPRGI